MGQKSWTLNAHANVRVIDPQGVVHLVLPTQSYATLCGEMAIRAHKAKAGWQIHEADPMTYVASCLACLGRSRT